MRREHTNVIEPLLLDQQVIVMPMPPNDQLALWALVANSSLRVVAPEENSALTNMIRQQKARQREKENGQAARKGRANDLAAQLREANHVEQGKEHPASLVPALRPIKMEQTEFADTPKLVDATKETHVLTDTL